MTNVFHPTALNEASQTAFYHALKLTLATRGKLNILHITEGGEDVSFNHFPGIRDTLVKWGLIEAGSEKGIVSTLGIDARKVIGTKGDPVSASVNYLDKHPAEFVVLATSQHQGLVSLFSGSVAEPIARQAGQAKTLFVPHGTSGFVAAEDGSVSLPEVLLPIATDPHPQSAIDTLGELLQALDIADATRVTLLHVGEAGSAPALRPPDAAEWRQVTLAQDVSIATVISRYAEEHAVDLVVMPTQGRHGFLDALRGSTTEQVMRELQCPLLAVPCSTT